MCVCMYVGCYLHRCMCARTLMCACMYVCIYMCVCMYVCTYVRTYVCMQFSQVLHIYPRWRYLTNVFSLSFSTAAAEFLKQHSTLEPLKKNHLLLLFSTTTTITTTLVPVGEEEIRRFVLYLLRFLHCDHRVD